MLDLYLESFESLKAHKSLLMRQIRGIERKLESLYLDEKRHMEALTISQTVAKQTQEQIQHQLCDIVTTALDTVFPDKYTFHIDFVIKRGKTEADMYLMDHEGNRYDPLEMNGGGVVVVCAFALRIACISITHGEKVLILDEPFISVQGEDQQRAVGDFLTMIRDQLGYQVIMVANNGSYLDLVDNLIEIGE